MLWHAFLAFGVLLEALAGQHEHCFFDDCLQISLCWIVLAFLALLYNFFLLLLLACCNLLAGFFRFLVLCLVFFDGRYIFLAAFAAVCKLFALFWYILAVMLWYCFAAAHFCFVEFAA